MPVEINKNCGIYKITSPTGRIYIGQAVNIQKRWHKYAKLHCKKQTTLYNSFKKYGVENHQFDIIEYCSEEELNCSERFWQDEFDVIGSNGLNGVLTLCGEKRYIASEETRKRISESLKGDKHPAYGKKGTLSPRFGKKASDDTRKKQSEAKKGKPGKKHTEESKEKCRQSKLGDKNPMSGKGGCEHPQSKITLCLQTGIYYDSLKDACEALCLDYIFTSNKVRKNNHHYLVFINNFEDKICIKGRNRVKNNKDNKIYNSIKEASKSVTVSIKILSQMLRGQRLNTTDLVLI